MTPEYYANLYRRFQTYVRHYDNSAPIKKICGGPNADDDNWTKKVLDTCYASPHPENHHGFMDELSLHYYTVPGTWDKKGSATDFTLKEWYATMYKALDMERILKKHFAVMDEYDPDKQIGMSVDEWGCWFDVEPGTNPGFLYQQNTMRDALVACATLNIFNNHCDRVRLACIAQMVNVLQSVILTEGEKMIKTPTYHVFNMYKYHQDADLVATSLVGNPMVGDADNSVPLVTESVSKSEDGTVNVTVGNLSAEQDTEITVNLAEMNISKVDASILRGEMDDYNSFDEPGKVESEKYSDINVDGRNVTFKLPKNSVVLLRIQ